jgi:GLPGLI family protein
MTKIILLTVIGFIAICASAQTKSGKITYSIANIDVIDKGTNLDFTNMLVMAKKQQFQLLFNNEFTGFTSVDYMKGENYSEFYNALAKTYISYVDFYFDYKNQKELEYLSDGTLLEQKIPKLNWQITSESKTIDQYECYKATYSFNYFSSRDKKNHTRTIIAWFAPSLPFAYGPKNFHGLPGLILELTENTITFLASKIELSESPIEIKIPSGTRIPKEQFEKAILKN